MVMLRRFQAASSSVSAYQQRDFPLPYSCPEGYSNLAIVSFSTGHAQALPADVSPTHITVYNTSGNAIQSAPSAIVVFIKTTLL